MDPRSAAYVISKFSVQFCNELEKKDVIASPLSCEILLALLALGCKDKVRSELLKALDFPHVEAIRTTFSTLKSRVESLEGVRLEIANKIYLNKGPFAIRADVKRDAEEVFGADIEPIDFENKEEAVAKINAWGSWKQKFDPAWTKDWPFYVDNNTDITVKGMSIADKPFWYGESEELQSKLLRMNYVGKETSMVIVLPHQIEGLDGLMKKLADGYDLITDIAKMYWCELEVMIPKFKIKTTIDLKSVLPKLGINAIFDRKNEDMVLLENPYEEGDLFVTVGKQIAFVEVNEEGSEAAACSTVMNEYRLCKNDPEPERKNFIAWRPFLFMIMLRNTPLFMGTYRGKK